VRVVALYLNVRIGVGGGAKRASLLATRSHPNQRNFLAFLFSEEGCGEEPTKNRKDISLVLDRRFVLQKVPFQSPFI
jgi:hypothetical protein